MAQTNGFVLSWIPAARIVERSNASALLDGFEAATGAMARHTEEIIPDPAAQAQLDARYRRWCAYRDALGAAWAPPQVLAFEPRETQERTSHG